MKGVSTGSGKFKPFVKSPEKKSGRGKMYRPPARHVKLDLCIKTDFEEEKSQSRRESPGRALRSR